MRRFVGIVMIWLAGAFSVVAQEATPEPQLEIIFETTETVPGQPLTLRLTVLVPTFMPEPPVWPDFETSNVMVRLPEKASSPTSKRIGGETWSGISRRYQVTPVVPGSFSLPEGAVRVRYRALEGSALLEATLPVPALEVVGVVPEGAEELQPFLAANSVRLTQSVEGETTGLKAGASFSRTLEALIEGVSPMFLPTLQPEAAVTGLRAYPESPALDETENRGIVSGRRTEKVVFVTEGGVDDALPEVTLRWYNLKSGKVEESTVEAVPVQAEAPVAAVEPTPMDWMVLVRWGAVLVAFALLLAAARRWLAPQVLAWHAALRARRLASAGYAYRVLQKVLRTRDLSATKQAYLVWRSRLPEGETPCDAQISDAFLEIGRAKFGTGAAASVDPPWRKLSGLVRRKNQESRYLGAQKAPDLPPMNPTAPQRT